MVCTRSLRSLLLVASSISATAALSANASLESDHDEAPVLELENTSSSTVPTATPTAYSKYVGADWWNTNTTSSTAVSSTSGQPAATNSATPMTRLQSCAVQMNGKRPAHTHADVPFTGNVRRYYIAAEEVEWDYAPTGWDNWLGVPFDQSLRAQYAGYVGAGTKWLKALYRGYTDDTFTQQTEQSPSQGTLGPTIRAEVGDMIEIMFVNHLSQNYATMHSMGLSYSKSSEGADYSNNTQPGEPTYLPESDAVHPFDAGVEPDGCVVYKWLVRESAGPNNGEPARAHSYHSYVSLLEDTNAGLIGPTFIYAQGKMESTMANYREFSLLYMIYNEDASFLARTNSLRQQGNYSMPAGPNTQGLNYGNQSVWLPQLTNIAGANRSAGHPSFSSINGYVYANNPTFDMCLQDNTIFYTIAYGSLSHVAHFHGNGFVVDGENEYAVSVNDGVGKTIYLEPTDPGLWQVICHVDWHQSAGMVANYRVYGENACPLPPLGSS